MCIRDSSLYNSSTATGVMEKNLDKLTVIVACVFAACVVLAMFFFCLLYTSRCV